MSTVEDLNKMQILDEAKISGENLNMPSIKQSNKRFFGGSSKSRSGYRGIFHYLI